DHPDRRTRTVRSDCHDYPRPSADRRPRLRQHHPRGPPPDRRARPAGPGGGGVSSRFLTLLLMTQSIVTLDMEGVLTPEIWIAVSEKTGIAELRRTTRDEPDYDKLMRSRLKILDQHGLKLSDIQQVIGTLLPLPGGKEFLDELHSFVQVIILSDTFEQFAAPLLRKLGWPTLLCHRLIVEHDRIV